MTSMAGLLPTLRPAQQLAFRPQSQPRTPSRSSPLMPNSSLILVLPKHRTFWSKRRSWLSLRMLATRPVGALRPVCGLTTSEIFWIASRVSLTFWGVDGWELERGVLTHRFFFAAKMPAQLALPWHPPAPVRRICWHFGLSSAFPSRARSLAWRQ